MLRVLGVHGIGTHRYHRRKGSAPEAAKALAADWFQHLGTAMPSNSSVDLEVAYYAHHLHPESGHSLDEDPDSLSPSEQHLLTEWIALLRPGMTAAPPEDRLALANDWLLRAHGPGTRLFALTFCRELHAYLDAEEARQAATRSVAEAIDEQRPQVVVAHSLGSVVAYEALWAHQEHDVDLLVTLGSPLAQPVVLDRLRPPENRTRPPLVRRWVNIADLDDIVAVPVRGISREFKGVDEDLSIAAGMWEFQTPGAYLRSGDVADVVFGRRSLT
ncbi:serine peptidase [Amycolatopsis dongchuanensis]